MTKSEVFMKSICGINEKTDFARLHQSLNGGEGVYGEEVLQQYKEIHRKIFGDRIVPRNREDCVAFPAKIMNEKDGSVWLGICLCLVMPLPQKSWLYNVMHGTVLETRKILIPAEYREFGEDPMEPFTGDSVVVSIYFGEHEAVQRVSYCESMKTDEEEPEEESETMQTEPQLLQ